MPRPPVEDRQVRITEWQLCCHGMKCNDVSKVVANMYSTIRREDLSYPRRYDGLIPTGLGIGFIK
jgi:hypothetical protein